MVSAQHTEIIMTPQIFPAQDPKCFHLLFTSVEYLLVDLKLLTNRVSALKCLINPMVLTSSEWGIVVNWVAFYAASYTKTYTGSSGGV